MSKMTFTTYPKFFIDVSLRKKKKEKKVASHDVVVGMVVVAVVGYCSGYVVIFFKGGYFIDVRVL